MAPALHRLEAIPSTQDVLHELAAAGAPGGTAVVAREQTLGRGSRGRGWASPPGGLWLSVLLRPGAEPGLEVLSLRAALAAALVIEHGTPGVVLGLKWPNDLMLAGKKLGGILCEARWQGNRLGWIAVGVGVNVVNPIAPALASHAVALASVAPAATVEALVVPMVQGLCGVEGRTGQLTPDEIARFAARDWLRGRRLREPMPGTADGVGADGALRLRKDDGDMAEIRAGTVRLADG
jgi:BirA family biotin operon repressor/biotin-[acetyl-CoA-carboxylase] ligase